MNEQIDEIKQWIEQADHDLGSAKIIYLHLPDYFDTIAFHCQQAVEKYLKAVLIHYQIEFRRTHDLVFLLDLLSTKMEITHELFQKAFPLNNFGVQIRYPNKIIKLSDAELQTAIQIAEEFQMFALQIIGIEQIFYLKFLI